MAEEEKIVTKEEEEEKPSEDNVVITFDEGSPLSEEERRNNDSSTIRHMRTKHKDLTQKNRDLEQRLETLTSSTKELEPMPTLAACDFNEGEFTKKLNQWNDTKRQRDGEAAQKQADRDKQESDWKVKLAKHEERKTALKVENFEDAETTVIGELSQTQLGIIIEAAENSAALMFALGNSPKHLSTLAAIKSPVDFAVTIGKLESQLKIIAKKPTTQPETILAGTGSIAAAGAKTLETLRAEAEKTGDYSSVAEYKRQLREQERK